jgi:hypothetical protein
MIDFRSYLTELFDRTFELDEYRNQFSFLVHEKGGRLLPVPSGGEALDKWVEENFNGTTPNVYKYVVDFTEIWLLKGYEEFALFYGIGDQSDIYELGFERRLVELDRLIRPRPVGSAANKKISRYYWRSLDIDGTDEDLNWLGAGEAAAVIGTVVEAAKRFVRKHRPRGVVIGTKAEANPARGRIYKALARKAAAVTRGTVYDLGRARENMAAPAIIWFRKRDDPFKGQA